MNTNGVVQIDLIRLLKYILKRIWIPILCMIIGFGCMYYHEAYMKGDTYTASTTMYVYNGNPNITNYQYTSSSDLNSAVQLMDTYMVVIRSNKVLDTVVERLNNGMSATEISKSLSMGSVNDTGVMAVYSTTTDPQLSVDICNAIADVAPAEIIRVVGAGSIEIIDYAELPTAPDGHAPVKKGITGALAGLVLGIAALVIMFLLNRRIMEAKEITDSYTPPLLASVPLDSAKKEESQYLLNEKSSPFKIACYGKLRTNLYFAVNDKGKLVMISSSIPGEGKSTVAANLAITVAKDEKHVLLIDGDMRRPKLGSLFQLPGQKKGLSNMLIGKLDLEEAIHKDVRPGLDVLPAGAIPPNPSELLNGESMRNFLKSIVDQYDMIILDTPPINVVADSLVLADMKAGMVFVTRENYSDHREIRRALVAAEFANVDVIGFVYMTPERRSDSHYGKYGYYYSYYDKNCSAAK